MSWEVISLIIWLMISLIIWKNWIFAGLEVKYPTSLTQFEPSECHLNWYRYRLTECYYQTSKPNFHNPDTMLAPPLPPLSTPAPCPPAWPCPRPASTRPPPVLTWGQSPLPPPHSDSLSCSRYSLSGGIKTVPVPYLPADTTRSVSSTSEYGDRAGGRVSVRPHSRTSRRPERFSSGPGSSSGSNSGKFAQLIKARRL